MGFLGGLIMIFLLKDPFKLSYIGGYLLVMIAVVFFATSTFIEFGKGSRKYWDKVYVGFLAFVTMELIMRSYQLWNKTLSFNGSSSDVIGTTIFILIFGFILSLLFALMKTT
jgi:hypothetical protein